jgi:uncharacterized membrane protein YtjA (UPF0391 family)
MGILFWVIMLMWLLFGYFGVTYEGTYRSRILGGWGLVTFLLFLLLGWKTFGPPLQ